MNELTNERRVVTEERLRRLPVSRRPMSWRVTLLALGAMISSCAHEPPAARAARASAPASHSFQELEQRREVMAREPASSLDAGQVDADLDLLGHALERGYGGRPFVPPSRWAEMSGRFEALRGRASTVFEFCNGVADALWHSNDPQLSAHRPSPSVDSSAACGSVLERQRRVASVGENYAADERAAPWVAEAVSVGSASFGVISLRQVPLEDDSSRASFERAVHELTQNDGIIIDLRGPPGGDDARAHELGRLLGDAPMVPSPVRSHQRKTPEALTLMMNAYAAIPRQSAGPPAPSGRYERAKQERDEAIGSRQSEWQVEPEPTPSPTLGPNAYRGPIAILVDATCASGCERSVEVLRRHPTSKVFGEQTAGGIRSGNVGRLTLPNSGILIRIPTTYYERPHGDSGDAQAVSPDIAVPSGTNAFDSSMAWFMSQTPSARVIKPADYIVSAAVRKAEVDRLSQLGLNVPEPGPILEKPWALPLERRSFVVPRAWLWRKSTRVVYAPALLADLDALELVMSRAYGGWAIAEKHGHDWRSWFEHWRLDLGAAGAKWLPMRTAFSGVERFQRFQLDNHTTIPLALRFGTGSRTVLLEERPTGTCTSLKVETGDAIVLNPADPAQKVKEARRFDGERLSSAWYLAFPANRGKLESVQCGGGWVGVTEPTLLDAEQRTASISSLSSQPADRPFLRHLTADVAYLRLPSFYKSNNEIIERERASWEKPSGHEQALIIDLRGNEGGDAAFEALAGWVSFDEIRSNVAFNQRAGASCAYHALRFGYSLISSGKLVPPLTDSMRAGLQSSLDALFARDDPECPAKYEERRTTRHYPGPRRPHRPRKGKPLLVLVVDHECGSDCELMTSTLAKLPEAFVVGVNTFGVMQYIQPGFSVLPNTRLPFRIALGTSDVYGDNRSTDGFGLDVDVVIDGEAGWNEAGLLRLANLLREPDEPASTQ
jgi:C-terminal processing protease CtpA/Prc